MNVKAMKYLISKLNKRRKVSLGNTIVQHVKFDRCTFAFITYLKPQPFLWLEVECMDGV